MASMKRDPARSPPDRVYHAARRCAADFLTTARVVPRQLWSVGHCRWLMTESHGSFARALLQADVDAAPGLIVGEMPLVATALGALGEQDGAWREHELRAEPRLELQRPTQSDHVLTNWSTMPIEARAWRAFFERHLGRLPGSRSMRGALEF